jgi:TetR/AcrR family transcriptional regulator, cholesterol catabolism regulator
METSVKTAAVFAKYQDDDRTAEIIYKASRIFYEKGFDGTSMNDIANAMGLTKAGLYHYVESKEDLLFTIMNFALDWLEREVIEPAGGISDPYERLRWVIRRHGRSMIEGDGAVAIVAEELLALSPKHRKQIEARRQVYYELVHEAILAMQAQGKLRAIDPAAAAYSLFGVLLWLPRWYRPELRLSTAQALDNVTSLFFNGLLKESSEH